MEVSPAVCGDFSALAERLAAREVLRITLPAGVTPAAVLVPIVVIGQSPALLFTERSNHVSDHKGQVSFPGGRIEAFDADERAAALREAEEEIGVDRASVRVLGVLDDTVTITGFRITPVVGVLPNGGPWRWNAAEIQSVFTVPIGELTAPGTFNAAAMTIQIAGNPVTLPAFLVGPHRIWGATCRIVLDFLDVTIGWTPPASP
ncbi:MAG: CoA pyrophosphatase [Deltaproteobacteria bacterium]|nr:CoA pyrophosphatase [Deltaproteobacteria bacterium]